MTYRSSRDQSKHRAQQFITPTLNQSSPTKSKINHLSSSQKFSFLQKDPLISEAKEKKVPMLLLYAILWIFLLSSGGGAAKDQK